MGPFLSMRIRTWSVATLLALVSLASAHAQPPGAKQAAECILSSSAPSLRPWLGRTVSRLLHAQPLTIVAIGSSSTAGAGASSSAAAYPSRLEALLKAQFSSTQIRVLNRGVNGEEASDMLARFDKDVIAEHPDLVLWQVGTNAVLRYPSIDAQAPVIRNGIARLKANGADVVLIDPQYAPQVIVKPEAEHMVALIKTEAHRQDAGVFQRFDLMHDWYTTRHLPFDTFVASDGLHMNDWGYNCLARQLTAALVEASISPTVTAASSIIQR